MFIFVRAPHPWGWEGLDHYHDLGLLLARGESFPTTDVPWGYAYFLAPFYRLFGDRPWIPLVAQALLNGLLPWLVYAYARTEFDERTAGVAAVLTGIFSFNTVYASTQSSDSVCTVLFMAAIVTFVRGWRRNGSRWLALSGLLAGIAAQFRPNLLLVPLLMAGVLVFAPPRVPQRLAPERDTARHVGAGADALDRPQLSPDRRDHPDQHSWRRAAVVRHAADRTVSSKPRSQPALDLRSAGVRLYEPR